MASRLGGHIFSNERPSAMIVTADVARRVSNSNHVFHLVVEIFLLPFVRNMGTVNSVFVADSSCKIE
ncbi:hypothetical protein HSB1_02730 [Halogranum salarium B-1]|uniref:Uncharacterized protein n=1 Tax=Halogranum salarium B-1 TaxID=1210908 RepID=J3EZX4_9EURY|nr:hypothetical protein HSB1_02730 [Halogranum salarium B-1]